MKRPSREELAGAVGKTVPDILGPGLRVLFCGINPSVYSAVVGHHFARPGNRFWPALHRSGFTPRLLRPDEDREMLELRLGLTNLAPRATVAAADLEAGELESGHALLRSKIEKYRPQWLAVLGISAFREAFEQPKATLGEQEVCIGDTKIWVLPNPSGLNAHYRPDDLARLFGELRERVAEEKR